MNAFPIGVRIAEYMNKNAGWEPIGYFQLWNPEGSGVFDYPTEHDYCDRTDVLHCKKFSRENRELLPEIVVIHLDSEGLNTTEMGKNWRGRKTRLFTSSPIAKEQIDLELDPIINQLIELIQKYELSYISMKLKNEKMSFWERWCKDGLKVFVNKKGKPIFHWDECEDHCVRRYESE